MSLWPAGQPRWAEGALAGRPLDGDDEGLWLVVIPLTFERARICVAEPGYDGDASVEHWCMSSPVDAIEGWLHYPEPVTGWNRHQRRDRTMEWPS